MRCCSAFISNSKPLVRVVSGMRSRGYRGRFATSSFSGVGMIDEMQGLAVGLIVSQVLPPPTRTCLRFIAKYQKHLREFDPEARFNHTNLEGYLSARVLV